MSSSYRKLKVDRILPESGSSKSFYLVPIDGAPLAPHAPGQYLPLRLVVPGQTEPVHRFYTLSDCANGEHYRLTIKKELPPKAKPDAPAGLGSSYFNDVVRAGDILDAKPPAGNFFLDVRRDHPVVMVAGGIGVTPLLSMLNAIVRHQPTRKVWFFYTLRHGGDHAFKDHLRALQLRHPNLHQHVFYSQPMPQDQHGTDYHHPGRLDVPLLFSILPPLQMEYYICGPGPMMDAIVSGLQKAGVREQQIRTESFSSASVEPDPVASSAVPSPAPAGATVTFQKSAKTVAWNPKAKSLWHFAEQHGVEIDSGCLFGDCGTCLTRLVHGKVVYNHPTVAKPDPDTCLPCSCRPEGSIVIDS